MKALILYPILGLPLVAWGGIATLSSFTISALIAYFNTKLDIHTIPFKWHTRFAVLAFVLASIHATAALIFLLT